MPLQGGQEESVLIDLKKNIAALAQNDNFFSGNPLLELLPTDGVLSIGLTVSSAAGPVTGDVEVDFMCGGEWVSTGYMPVHVGTVPRAPVVPDDFVLTCEALANDRPVLKVRNKHATVSVDVIARVLFEEA